ncbi:MAG: DUF2155 domain-containing protein [Hyphomicrobiales bacterium]|nr:MAG: DUF2155 domain-containing protein [Hyphomicrobiales bacterium]
MRTQTTWRLLHLEASLFARLLMGMAALPLLPSVAVAQRVDNSVAVFAALDKVTAKISRLEVPLNQTATFGSLKVTPRACYTRPPTEQPKTTSFVEIDEMMLEGKEKRIFTGWMFAQSPGLNAVEHPVFDVWLTDCSFPRNPNPARPSASAPPTAAAPAGQQPQPPPAEEPRRRRPPR